MALAQTIAPTPRLDISRTIQWLIYLVTAVLMLAPALPILAQVFVDRPLYAQGWQFTLDNIVRLFASAEFGRAALNTAIFAGLTVTIAQVLGIFTALVLGRTNLPGRQAIGAVMMWPLYLSHLIFAVGWVIVYGPSGFATLGVANLLGGTQPWNLYSVGGMAVVAGISQAPLAYLYCMYGAVRSVDPALENAARTVGAGPIGVLRRVTLPLMIPSIVTSTALNLIISIETLSIPLFLGRPDRIETISTYLYTLGVASSTPQYGLIAASSVLLIVLVLSTLLLQRLILKHGHRYETVKGKGARTAALQLGPWAWPLAILMGLFAFFTIVLPIAGIVLRAFTVFLSPLVPFWTMLTLANFERLFTNATFVRSIGNTFFISLAAASTGTLLAALIALVVQRSDFRFKHSLEMLAYSPRVIPGLITGIGVFYAAIVFAPFGWLRDSVWIIVLAYVMATLPLGLGVIQPAVVQISADLDKAARTSGADWLQSMFRIMLPLLKSALLGSFVLLFITYLKSYIIAIFLMAPGLEVMGVSMLTLWTNGEVGVTSAFATVQILAIAVFLLAARLIFKVKLYD